MEIFRSLNEEQYCQIVTGKHIHRFMIPGYMIILNKSGNGLITKLADMFSCYRDIRENSVYRVSCVCGKYSRYYICDHDRDWDGVYICTGCHAIIKSLNIIYENSKHVILTYYNIMVAVSKVNKTYGFQIINLKINPYPMLAISSQDKHNCIYCGDLHTGLCHLCSTLLRDEFINMYTYVFWIVRNDLLSINIDDINKEIIHYVLFAGVSGTKKLNL